MKLISLAAVLIGAMAGAGGAHAQTASANDRVDTGPAMPSTVPNNSPSEGGGIASPGSGDQRPPALPPAILTLVTLGNAGLLQSTFSLERNGLTEARNGEARATIGFATASGISRGYEDNDRALVLPLGVMKSFPIGSGAGFIRGSVVGTFGDAERNLQWNKGSILRSDVQFLYAPTPTTLIGAGVIYQRTRFDNFYTPIAQRGTSDRDGWGARLDYAGKLSKHVGITARGQFTRGDYDIKIPASGFRHRQNLSDYYLQSELIGTFASNDTAIVPEGWVLHPTLGINFRYGQFERTANSFGIVSGSVVGPDERYGTLWGDLRLEKAAAMSPGLQFLPFVTAGIEQEYINNLDTVIREPTYGHLSTGFALTVNGQRIDFAYNNHFGFKGRRDLQNAVISTSLFF